MKIIKLFLVVISLAILLNTTYSIADTTKTPDPKIKADKKDQQKDTSVKKSEVKQNTNDSTEIQALKDTSKYITQQIKSSEQKLDKQILLIYFIGGCTLISLILGSIALLRSSKIKHLEYKIQNPRSDNRFKELQEQRVSEMNNIKNKFNSIDKNISGLNNDISEIRSEVENLRIRYNATTSFSSNVQNESRQKERIINKIVSETVPEPKSETFIVEYFVDGGVIKFRETNSGSPFYIEKFEDRSELTINENTYAASNYSESIQKCFSVNGTLTGKYRNIKSALCDFDKTNGSWKLTKKGEIESF